MDILKEEWEVEEKSDEPVVSYVLSLREWLESMAEHVQNLRKAQRYQKAWYDRNARERSFQLGDQVLILLPVPTPHQQVNGTVAGTLSGVSAGRFGGHL